jgi:L-ribulose-5-phosphate 4-epimerase
MRSDLGAQPGSDSGAEPGVDFTPTPEKLTPDLSRREELVLLARTLWREGYNDHLAGHITCNLGDGTLLCNPWLLTWNELRPGHVIRIDLDGNVVEGDWPVPLGIPLHLELHKLRGDVAWALHNHPLYGTVWADKGEVPPVLDQSSALGGGELVLVDEYDGPVNDPSSARRAIEKMGDANLALLAGHGVFVLGGSARAVHQRAVALEQRCQRAWHVRAAGTKAESRLPRAYLDAMRGSDGERFIGFWEAMVREELRADPTLLD